MRKLLTCSSIAVGLLGALSSDIDAKPVGTSSITKTSSVTESCLDNQVYSLSCLSDLIDKYGYRVDLTEDIGLTATSTIRADGRKVITISEVEELEGKTVHRTYTDIGAKGEEVKYSESTFNYQRTPDGRSLISIYTISMDGVRLIESVDNLQTGNSEDIIVTMMTDANRKSLQANYKDVLCRVVDQYRTEQPTIDESIKIELTEL